jgi:anti-sigma factor RsiW
MIEQHWTDRLSDYIDGDLALEDAEALEAHLLECADCGRALHELRAVVTRAGQVIDRPPDTDLWPDIAARIAVDRASDVGRPRSRRFSFSIPQLVAASFALMLLSGSTMYLLLKRDGAPQVAVAPSQSGNAAPVTTDRALATPVAVTSPAAENYNVAINELERALASGSSQLDTATVRVLESNLRIIDGAIAEAQAALGRDPGNPYLNRYLDQTMQKKIQLLRRATGILRAQT